ncbi:protein phosphatase 1 regulatory subunit 7 [Pycnococcus provasolii]
MPTAHSRSLAEARLAHSLARKRMAASTATSPSSASSSVVSQATVHPRSHASARAMPPHRPLGSGSLAKKKMRGTSDKVPADDDSDQEELGSDDQGIKLDAEEQRHSLRSDDESDSEDDDEETKLTTMNEAVLREGAGGESLNNATVISLHNKGIRLVENLDRCKNLRSLDLSFNNLAYIHGMSDCPDIRELLLYNNPLEDAYELRRLIKLVRLHLHNCKLDTMQGLGVLKQLTELRCDGNRLKDIDPVRSMSALKQINVSRNPTLSSLKPLEGCLELESVSASDCAISSCIGLERCSKLSDLVLSSNPGISMQGLGAKVAARLDILALARCELVTFPPTFTGAPGGVAKAASRVQASSRGAAGNETIDTNSEAPFARLNELNVHGNRLTDLDGVHRACPDLEILDVGANAFTDIDEVCAELSTMTGLSEVILDGNPWELNLQKISTSADVDLDVDASSATSVRRLVFARVSHISRVDDAVRSSAGTAVAASGRFSGRPSTPLQGSAATFSSTNSTTSPSSTGSGKDAAPSTGESSEAAGSSGTRRVGGKGKGVQSTPLLNSRPWSARAGGGSGVILPTGDEFADSAKQFYNDFADYEQKIRNIMGDLRKRLALPVAEHARIVKESELLLGERRSVPIDSTDTMPAYPKIPNLKAPTKKKSPSAGMDEARAIADASHRRKALAAERVKDLRAATDATMQDYEKIFAGSTKPEKTEDGGDRPVDAAVPSADTVTPSPLTRVNRPSTPQASMHLLATKSTTSYRVAQKSAAATPSAAFGSSATLGRVPSPRPGGVRALSSKQLQKRSVAAAAEPQAVAAGQRPRRPTTPRATFPRHD